MGAPVKGGYFENVSPVTGKVFCEVARHRRGHRTAPWTPRTRPRRPGARPQWRSAPSILNQIADRIEENLEVLAVAETWDNGKPVRETLAADMPLAVDHFRYFAGAIRAQEGTLSQIDDNTTAYHFHEPLGVVGQIIPWNFPILMAVWKLAPALAAGNAVVLKPAEQTPASILVLMELIGDLLPAGVLNVVNGFGVEAGKPLASSKRIRKIAFTGETTTGRLIMQYASQNLIPVTLELGGKSPNIFFADVAAGERRVLRQGAGRLHMFALNQGEVCTCPSRALVQDSIYDSFMSDALAPHRGRSSRATRWTPTPWWVRRPPTTSWRRSSPTWTSARPGGRQGPHRRRAAELDGDLAGGFYVQPTIFEGTNNMRIFQEEIFGPVVSVTGSPTTTKPSRSPTTPSTASAPASGPATATPPTGPAGTSRPAGSG